MNKGIFITGTGTDVGKTYVAGLLVKKLHEQGINVGYFKVAMSGNDRDTKGRLIPGDALRVKTVSGISQPLDEMCPYVYEHAFSPHLASRIEDRPVDLNKVNGFYKNICQKYEFVVAEGSGGVVCPIRYDDKKVFLIDIIKLLNLSCLIVADAGLGTINGVVLTCEYMKQHNLNTKGIIFNNFEKKNIMHQDNKLMCEEITGIPVIECVEKDSAGINLSPENLFTE